MLGCSFCKNHLPAMQPELSAATRWLDARLVLYGVVFKFQPLDRNLVADGNAAVTGAFAALAEYFTSKQNAQNDCGLNLGWTAPSARLNAHSINNTKICASSFLRVFGFFCLPSGPSAFGEPPRAPCAGIAVGSGGAHKV